MSHGNILRKPQNIFEMFFRAIKELHVIQFIISRLSDRKFRHKNSLNKMITQFRIERGNVWLSGDSKGLWYLSMIFSHICC